MTHENWRATEKQDVIDHCVPRHRLAVSACIEIALREMDDAYLTQNTVDNTNQNQASTETQNLTGYVVDWGNYYEVAKRANMREKAAVVEHFLVKEYQRYKVSAPVFKSFERLQDEQGAQMATLMETGGGKEEVTHLVETHTAQLAIAHQAADICLKQLQHQQKHIFRQALESLMDRNPDTFPYVQNATSLSKETPESNSVSNGSRNSLFEYSSAQSEADTSASEAGSGVIGFGTDVVRQINRFNPVNKIMRAAGGASPAGSASPSSQLGDLNPFKSRDRSDSDAKQPEQPDTIVPNMDITADNSSSSLYLTVLAVKGEKVGHVRGMSVECPVKLVNIKTATAACLLYDSKGVDLDKTVIQRRVDMMRRVVKDELTAWLVPISIHDITRMAGDTQTRSFDAYCDVAKDIMKVMPPHIVEAAIGSPELVFLSLVEAIAESLATLRKANCGTSYFRSASNYSLQPGTILCTKHSNMPRCQLLLLALYDPLNAKATEQAMVNAVALTQNATNLFVDTTKVAHPELLQTMLQTVVKEKIRSLAMKTPVFKRNFPLHTPSGVKDKIDAAQNGSGGSSPAPVPVQPWPLSSPALSIVLSATQLASSLDFAKGPFSPFSPTLASANGSASPSHSPR